MKRQTECRDYSDGQFPGMAVIRANNHFHGVHVAQRLSSRLVVLDRFAEGCPPRTRLADALDDVSARMLRDGKHPEAQGARLSPFAISFAWLLLVYGAGEPQTALRLEVDPVCGLVGYASQLAGEVRFIGSTLLSVDPLVGEETLLDHLRGTVALAQVLPDPAWYCFVRERVEAGESGALSLLAAGGTRYRFYFDTGGEPQDQRDRLVKILTALTAQTLNRSPLAFENSSSLFERMWRMGWFTENWQPVHVRTLFGSRPSVHYEHLLHECFEASTMILRGEGK